MQLSKEDDPLIRKYCAASFRNMSHKRKLCEIEDRIASMLKEMQVPNKSQSAGG